jgi:hypothetical protein
MQMQIAKIGVKLFFIENLNANSKCFFNDKKLIENVRWLLQKE